MASSGGQYLGPWVDWSRGRILGATITLSNRNAGLLVAFFALFVSFAMGRLWTLASHGVYYLGPGSRSTDELRREHLDILHISTAPETAVWRFGVLGYDRRSDYRSFRRTALWALFAFFSYALVGAAAIFSPNAIKVSSSETLVHSSQCGFWDFKQTENSPAINNQKMLNLTADAMQYARNCYGEAARKPSQCRKLTKRDIKWKSESNVECPFMESICRVNTTAAYRMDTGLLDSHIDLGINAPTKDRIKFRKVTTCATLNGTRFGKMENVTDSAGRTDHYLQLHFGHVRDISEYTYQINTDAAGANYGYALT
jgi:hypothetical protein